MSAAKMAPHEKRLPANTDFLQHLSNHGIYPNDRVFHEKATQVKPPNLAELDEALKKPLATPESLSKEDFERFQNGSFSPSNEIVLETLLSVMERGSNAVKGCRSGGKAFDNLECSTDETVAAGEPDHYHGTLQKPNALLLDKLGRFIQPTKDEETLIAPNFFLAVGGGAVKGALPTPYQKALYHGALGARGMHKLDTFEDLTPCFDKAARVITCTFYEGTLGVFSVHCAGSQTSDRVDYFMTGLRSVRMTESRESFQEGLTLYRNAMVWARKQREKLVTRAVKKAEYAQQACY